MKNRYYAACSASGEIHFFGDADLLTGFLLGRSTQSWNVYKNWRGEWHWIPVQEGMSASQVRKAILRA